MLFNGLQIFSRAILVVILLFPVGHLYAQPGDHPQTIKYGLEKTGNTLDSAISKEVHIGHVIVEKYPDSAFRIFQHTMQMSKAAEFNIGIARSLYGMGTYYSINEDYDTCIVYYQQALLYERGSQRLHTMHNSCLYNIGEAYYRKGEFGQAALYYYKVLENIQSNTADLQILMQTYNRLAAIWAQLNVYKNAVFYVEQLEQLARINNNKKAIAGALSTKAGIFIIKSQWNKAFKYYNEALTIENELGDDASQANVQSIHINLAHIYMAWKMPEKAAKQARLVYQLPPGQTSLLNHIDAAYLIGKSYAKMGQLKKAESYLLPALEIADSKGMNTINPHSFLYEIYTEAGQYEKALHHLQIYMYLQDSLRGQRNVQAAGLVEAKYQNAEKDKQIALKELEITKQQNRTNLWIIGTGAGVVLLSIIFMAVYRSSKNKQRLQQNQIRSLNQEQEILHQQKSLLQQEQEIIQLKAMMKGEERERTRIARELHDGIGGMLAAIKMNVDMIQEQNSYDTEKQSLNRVMRMVEETTGEVRKTAHNLMPDILMRNTLSKALQIYFESINTGSQQQIELKLYHVSDMLDKSTELILYRIVQELVQNIIKHAGACQAIVELTQNDENLSIIVEDNGAGFDMEIMDGGFGLQNLRYRVQALQGEITIESAKDIGTTIHIDFNLLTLYKAFAS